MQSFDGPLLPLEAYNFSAESEVRKLHHKYGYYLDKCLYKEVSITRWRKASRKPPSPDHIHQVTELFSDRPDAYVQFLNGRFKGKESIRRLYLGRFAKVFVGGRNGPIDGWLLDHLMAQDVVDFQPGTDTVKLRGRTLMSAGTHESMSSEYPGGHRQWWEGGLYENEYVRENGTWKIFRLRYHPFWHGRFKEGWQHVSEFVPLFKDCYPAYEFGPDELVPHERLWPDTRVVPFHYPHPITGEMTAEEDLRAPSWRQPTDTSAPARKIEDWLV